MSAAASSLAYQIESRTLDPKSIGSMLLDSWNQKKSLSGKISNIEIDALIDRCIKFGSSGGKLLGAGGGGFILVQVNDPLRFAEEFKEETLIPVNADQFGSRIILKV